VPGRHGKTLGGDGGLAGAEVGEGCGRLLGWVCRENPGFVEVECGLRGGRVEVLRLRRIEEKERPSGWGHRIEGSTPRKRISREKTGHIGTLTLQN